MSAKIKAKKKKKKCTYRSHNITYEITFFKDDGLHILKYIERDK